MSVESLQLLRTAILITVFTRAALLQYVTQYIFIASNKGY